MKKLINILLVGTVMLIASDNTISCNNTVEEINNRTVSDELIPSAVNSSWYSNLKLANNLTLVNNKQLVVSNIENYAPISDVNLDFSAGKTINDLCGAPEEFFTYFNGVLYGKDGCDTTLGIFKLNSKDPDGNYWPTKDFDTSVTHSSLPTVSNNNIYVINVDDNIIYNASDINTITEVSNLTNFSKFSDVTKLNYIYNINDILYVGTDHGLYKSEDNGKNYSLINRTENLSVNSIIASPENNEVYFGTDANGLWNTNINSTIAEQVLKTQEKKINYSSLAIINDNLYFGMENAGLYILNNLNTASINRLVSSDISETENIKTIIKDDNNDLLILTNKNIVKIKML